MRTELENHIDYQAIRKSMARIVFLLASILVCQLSITVDAKITYGYVNSSCNATSVSYTNGGVYEYHLSQLLRELQLQSSSLKFYDASGVDTTNHVYGLFQCRDDVGFDVCSACVKNASLRIIEECPSYGEAIVWYEECTLRYADRPIISLMETSPGAYRWSETDVSNYNEISPKLKNILKDLSKNASSSLPHFARRETLETFGQLYSFAQCTPDIDSTGCYYCLQFALSDMIQNSDASLYSMVFFPSCQLRYDTTGPFLNNQAPPPHSSSVAEGSKTRSFIIPIVVVCVSVGLIVIAIVVCICLCKKKPKETSNSNSIPSAAQSGVHDRSIKVGTEDIGETDFKQYDFATLKSATRDFFNDNKLGQGGFGSVYKGKLENGEDLAIKRLSGTSAQGTKEFMTETRLLAKLQHKNLVKLLGFCSEGEEKLLVYEFMSNSSLDGFLFHPRKRLLLDWKVRSKIIMGIARGLQYLHEDSRLTIIHRDLKPGNILLDKEMNPKITDFGLAKLFEGEQTFGNTSRIAGTIGYMAPEYMETGKYSDKSDVYSFGILLLEIVSGQNNKKFYQSHPKEDLPAHAWRLRNEKQLLELVDPGLDKNYSKKDVVRCTDIGLLCLQANAEERPTMTIVVSMLTSSGSLPLPSTPAMSFPQFNIPIANRCSGQNDIDQYFTKSLTTQSDMDQELC